MKLRRYLMKLTKEEARWLDNKWNDFYYYFEVADMFDRDKIYPHIYIHFHKEF